MSKTRKRLSAVATRGAGQPVVFSFGWPLSADAPEDPDGLDTLQGAVQEALLATRRSVVLGPGSNDRQAYERMISGCIFDLPTFLARVLQLDKHREMLYALALILTTAEAANDPLSRVSREMEEQITQSCSSFYWHAAERCSSDAGR